MSTLRERLDLFIKYKGLSARSFEKAANIANGTVVRANNSLRDTTLIKIAQAFPDLNIEWVQHGIGQMLITEPSIDTDIDKSAIPSDKCIRFYPNVEASMGSVDFLDAPSEETKKIYIPGYEHCTDAIVAYGDSMLPTIKSGNIVLLSRWYESFVDYGKIYLVITESGYRAIKRLKKATDESKVLCVSDNPEHEPFEVERQGLVLYKVHGWINREDF